MITGLQLVRRDSGQQLSSYSNPSRVCLSIEGARSGCHGAIVLVELRLQPLTRVRPPARSYFQKHLVIDIAQL